MYACTCVSICKTCSQFSFVKSIVAAMSTIHIFLLAAVLCLTKDSHVCGFLPHNIRHVHYAANSVYTASKLLRLSDNSNSNDGRYDSKGSIGSSNNNILYNSNDNNSNNGIKEKVIVVRGDVAKGYPLTKDQVEINWKIFSSTNYKQILHDSSKVLNEPFEFTIGANPRHVIVGWESAVKQMYQGEIARFTIDSSAAFADKGLPGIGIEPNEDLYCELELVDIIPSLARTYKEIGEDESISGDLLEKLDSGESPLRENAMKNEPLKEQMSEKDRRYFDPKLHALDPNQLVQGSSSDQSYVWDESSKSIDVEVSISRFYAKDELVVSLHPDRISVRTISNDVIIEGKSN